MKVTQQENSFTPITFTVVLETEKERNALHNILNHGGILDASGVSFTAIREILNPKLVSTEFEEFETKLRRLIKT